MWDELLNTFNNNYMPHGHCYFWEPFILWSHAISDSVIAIAYLTIPISLVKIVRGRKEDDFAYKWILVLFAIFILGCGATHIMDVINIWEPWYYTDSFFRIITALASIGTAIMLFRITPQLIMVPSGRKWQQINNDLKVLNESLELKVQARTAELQALADRYQFMANAIPQIVWTAVPDGTADYLNATWFKFTGQTEEEATDNGWLDHLHPEDLAAANTIFAQALQNGTPFEAKIRIRDYTGRFCWHLSRSEPMKDAGGNIVKWFGTSTNIHEQIEKQEQLQRINEDLDNFVYTASHDLKTPILNVEGLLNILSTKAPAGDRKDIQNIYGLMNKSVEQLKHTIHDLADISRIQQETATDIHWINLPELIEEFKVNHLMLYEETGATIEIQLAEAEILCMSRKHMRSLLDNLLSNALKYRNPDITPHILIKSETLEGNYKISVQDNGIGIPKEFQDKVFDMFKRFHRHTSGTGVGLYIVKKIVEKYGGRIEVASKEGVGTTFTLWLKCRA